MHVLLPPSETKATRKRGAHLQLDSLTLPQLSSARRAVAQAVAEVSSGPDAPEVLGVSANLADEIARNTALFTAPTLPAADMYTGVLYDALDLPSLPAGGKTRANRRILIFSGLYGVVGPKDKVAPYRLSMGVNLPGIGPLASYWKARLDAPLAERCAGGLIVDCRSSTYTAAWTPTGEAARGWVQIRVPGATHMAKHTRGLVTRHLMTASSTPRSPKALAALLSNAFDVSLHEPKNARSPWILDTTARPDV